MTTEPTPPITDADVVAAAGEVRAVWQAKEFSDNHHRYMIARLEYEWPTLARAIKRLTSVHTDATTCHAEYTEAGYDAGTVICERGRDHAGAHEGEGYDSERYTWQQVGAGETLLDHEDAQRMNVGGRPPLHDPAAPPQPNQCGALRPCDPRTIPCTREAGHHGMHRNRDGNVAYQWDGDAGPRPLCGAHHPDLAFTICALTTGHAGHHESDDRGIIDAAHWA